MCISQKGRFLVGKLTIHLKIDQNIWLGKHFLSLKMQESWFYILLSVPGGLTLREGLTLLEEVHASGCLRGLDLVSISITTLYRKKFQKSKSFCKCKNNLLGFWLKFPNIGYWFVIGIQVEVNPSLAKNELELNQTVEAAKRLILAATGFQRRNSAI